MSSPQRSTTVTAPEVTSLQSTPSNRGLSAGSNLGMRSVRVYDLTPRVTEDLRKAQHCNKDGVDNALKYFLQRASKHPDDSSSNTALLDECLKKVLPICNGQGDNRVASSKMKFAIETYTKATTEAGMYTPFTDATKAALECLHGLDIDGMRDPDDKMEVAFQRNDKKAIAQNHGLTTSTRFPDVIVVNKQVNHSDEAGDDGSHVEGQANGTKDKIYWQNVLSVVEFKRRRKPMEAPPKEYEVLSETMAVDPMTNLNDLRSSGDAKMAEGLQSGKSETPSLKRPSEGDPEERSAKRNKTQNPLASTNLSIPTKPPTATHPKPPAAIQAALYAAEMLSANVTVNYIINFTVLDDQIWLWIYDHQGVISVGGFNFVKDLPRFLVLLFALQRFRLDEWGRSPDFKVSESGKKLEVTVPVPGENERKLKLQLRNPARVPHLALNGRGTDVIDLICPELEKQDQSLKESGMVAKVYWGEEQRESEAAILDVIKKIAAVNEDVRGHVPILLLSHKFDVSTSTIRTALGIKVDDAKRGSRTLYLLAFPKLRPIFELQPNPKELYDVWVQCIICHYALWKCNVHHRDVSAANLMYYRINGKLMGVLNDYDLATLGGSKRKFGNERTGTIPFMALDLLQENGQKGNVAHRYRHDLESFVWVFIWVSCLYKDSNFRKDHSIAEWATFGATQCAERKEFFLHHIEEKIPSDLASTVRHRVLHCALGINKQLNFRGERKLELADNQASLETVHASEVAKVQASILRLEKELKEKGDDEVFSEFAKWINFKDICEVIQRATEAMVILE